MPPEVTVLLSVYNGEKYLRESIESILNQTFTDFEFLIIDDGSIDSSQQIILSYDDKRITLYPNKQNLGLSKSLNIGIRQAQGMYIARQDADDVSHIDRINQLYTNILESGSSIVFCRYQYMSTNDKMLPWVSERISASLSYDQLWNAQDPICHGAVIFNKDDILKIGGYDENFRFSQDYELWTRITGLGYDITSIDLIGYYYRLTPNYNAEKRIAQKRYTRLIREASSHGQIIDQNKILEINTRIKDKTRDSTFLLGRIFPLIMYRSTLARIRIRSWLNTLGSKLRNIIRKYISLLPISIKRNLFIWLSRPYIQQLKGHEYTGPSVFETVFFELRTKCNGHCSFCAASVFNETRADVTMDFSVFKKAIDDLNQIDYSGRIAFHITSEPLLFSQLSEYMEYAREKLPKAWFQLLTNGRKLDFDLTDKLLNAGLNEITVNWYLEDLSTPIPEKFFKIKTEVLEKYYDKRDILPGFGPYSKENRKIFRYNVFKRKQSEIISNQAGSAPNKKTKLDRNFLGFCHSPMTDFHITTDGTVSKCSKDVYFSDPMGNIHNEDILSIWKGNRFKKVRRMLLSNNRQFNPMCLGCDYFGLKQSLLREQDTGILHKKVHNLLAALVYYNE